MVAKESFVRALDGEIERWDADLRRLAARGSALDHHAKQVFERELAQFRDRRDRAYAMVRQIEATLREWRDAADHSWDGLFDEADRAVRRLREIWQRLVAAAGAPPASRGDAVAKGAFAKDGIAQEDAVEDDRREPPTERRVP